MSFIKQIIEDVEKAYRGHTLLYDFDEMIVITKEGFTGGVPDCFLPYIFKNMGDQIKLMTDIYRVKEIRRELGKKHVECVEWAIGKNDRIFALACMDGEFIELDGDMAIAAVIIAQEIGAATYNLEVLR